jgi:hypothetical protein
MLRRNNRAIATVPLVNASRPWRGIIFEASERACGSSGSENTREREAQKKAARIPNRLLMPSG